MYDPAAGASAIIDSAWSYPVEITELGGKIYIVRNERSEIWAYDPTNPSAGAALVAIVE